MMDHINDVNAIRAGRDCQPVRAEFVPVHGVDWPWACRVWSGFCPAFARCSRGKHFHDRVITNIDQMNGSTYVPGGDYPVRAGNPHEILRAGGPADEPYLAMWFAAPRLGYSEGRAHHAQNERS